MEPSKNKASDDLKIISNKGANLDFDPLKDLIDNTSEVIMMLSPDLDFLFVNQAFRDTLGYNISSLRNMKLEDMLHPQFKDDILEQLKEVEKGIFFWKRDKLYRYFLNIFFRYKIKKEQKMDEKQCIYRYILLKFLITNP